MEKLLVLHRHAATPSSTIYGTVQYDTYNRGNETNRLTTQLPRQEEKANEIFTTSDLIMRIIKEGISSKSKQR